VEEWKQHGHFLGKARSLLIAVWNAAKFDYFARSRNWRGRRFPTRLPAGNGSSTARKIEMIALLLTRNKEVACLNKATRYGLDPEVPFDFEV
jgi:hypothetical protein